MNREHEPSAGHGIRRRAEPIVATMLLVASALGALTLAAVHLSLLLTTGAGDASLVALAPAVLAYAGLGWLILRRRPGHRIGWVFLLTAVSLVAVFWGFSAAATLTEQRGHDDLVAGIAGWIPIVLFTPAVLLAFPFLALLFPDGNLPGPRWRWPVGIILAVVVVGELLLAFAPGELDPTLAANPFVIPWVSPELRALGATFGLPATVAASVLGIAAIVVRFRRGPGDEREQLKWMLAAIVVVVFLVLPTLSGSDVPVLLSIASSLSLILVPAAATVAILSYRLYDIDRLVSRTLAYALITALLVAVFVAGNLVLQLVLGDVLPGQTLPVAASTMLAFALFQPIRGRVQRAVDRRFDRVRYDAQRTVDGFSEAVRNEVDLDLLRAELSRTAGDAVRPLGVSVWLRGA